jgi:hypothetical protein
MMSNKVYLDMSDNWLDSILLQYVNRTFGQKEALKLKADIIAALEDKEVDDRIPCEKCPHWMFLHDEEGHCGGGCH